MKNRFVRLLFSLLTPVWLAFQRRKPATAEPVSPVEESASEIKLEILNEVCGHNDRTIPLDLNCPKCRALLQPIDFEAVARSRAAMAAGTSPLPPTKVRRAFVLAPVPDAEIPGLTDEELAQADFDLQRRKGPALGLARPLGKKAD